MIRKFLMLFLSVALAISTCACGRNTNTAGTTQTDETSISAAETENEEETQVSVTTASSAESQTSESQADETSAEAVPSEVIVSIKPPDGWEPVEGSVLPVQYMKGTASFMVVHELYFSTSDLDTVVEEAKGMFSGQFDNVAYIGDTTTVSIDGNEARNFIWTCDMSSVTFKYNYTYVKVGENIYSIVLADFAETYDDLSADFDQILKDIRFV